MKARLFPLMALMGALAIPGMAYAEESPEGMAAAVSSVESDSVGASANNSAVSIKDEDSSKADDKSWGVGATIAFDLGVGAFVKDEHARRTRSRFTMSINGFYTIPVIDVDIHAETGFSQWLSKTGTAQSNSKYEFRWADSSIGLSRNIWSYKSGAFSVSFDGDLSFVLPTSTASINANLYTTIMPGLSALIKYDRVSLAYAITYGYNAHEYTSTTLDPHDVDVLSRSTGNEIIDSHNIAIDGVLAEHELANQFVIGIDCIRKMLSLSIGLAFSDSWTYDNGTITKDDDLVGLHAKAGRGHSQMSQGSLVLAYTPIKYATISLGMVSTQPWKTADNKTLRFPWFDAETPSNNYTKFILSAAFNY